MGNITISNASLNKESTWSVLNLKFAISNINVIQPLDFNWKYVFNVIPIKPKLSNLFYKKFYMHMMNQFGECDKRWSFTKDDIMLVRFRTYDDAVMFKLKNG